jgi:surface carbohydrate biosynthesis protein
MTKNKRIVYIPIEIHAREYTSKLLLSIKLIESGYEVVFGYKYGVLKNAWKAKYPGILFNVSAPKDPSKYTKYKEKGFILVAQDEESGALNDEYQTFFESRIKSDTDSVDAYFCWGQDEYNFFKKIKPFAKNIYLTGSPRTYLWSKSGYTFYKEEIQKLQNRFGNYVLFVGNFASGNWVFKGSDALANIKNEWIEHHHNLVKRDNKIIKVFKKAITKLSETKKYNIVIRPHPTEDKTMWEEFANSKLNVSVVSNGDLTPLIMAAKCVVHNSCTSGIESALCDVPVIALGGDKSDLEQSNQTISNKVSIPIYPAQKILDAVNNIDDYWNKKKKNILNTKLHNHGSDNVFHEIINVFEKFNNLHVPRHKQKNLFELYYIFHDVLVYLKELLYKTGNMSDLGKRKRILLTKRMIMSDIDKFLQNDYKVSVSRIGNNCFLIRKNN